jgi:hypothetical protein
MLPVVGLAAGWIEKPPVDCGWPPRPVRQLTSSKAASKSSVGRCRARDLISENNPEDSVPPSECG